MDDENDNGMDWEPPEVEDGLTKQILFTPPTKKRSTMTIRGSKIHQVFELNEPVLVEQHTLEDLAQQPDLYQYATPDKNTDGRSAKAGEKRVMWTDKMVLGLLAHWWRHAPSPFYKDNRGKKRQGVETLKLIG